MNSYEDLEVLVSRMEQCIAQARLFFVDREFPNGNSFTQDQPRRFPPFTEEERRRVREAGWDE